MNTWWRLWKSNIPVTVTSNALMSLKSTSRFKNSAAEFTIVILNTWWKEAKQWVVKPGFHQVLFCAYNKLSHHWNHSPVAPPTSGRWVIIKACRTLINSIYFQVLQASCAVQHVTFSTLCTTRWIKTWISLCVTTSSLPLTTRTWLETSFSPIPRPTCTPGSCSPAAAA